MTTTDFLDRLDAAIGCQQCEGELGDSPSDDFCGDECRRDWFSARSEPIDEWAPDAATVYVGRDAMHWYTWRLPRSTGDLDVVGVVFDDARNTAYTDEQRRACAVLDHPVRTHHNGARLHSAYIDEPQRFLLGEWTVSGGDWTGRDSDDDHPVPEPVLNPMQAALEARRNRNTGPARPPLDRRRRRR